MAEGDKSERETDGRWGDIIEKTVDRWSDGFRCRER